PVVIVTRWPTARLRTMVGCPMQLSRIVVVMRPPLYASIDDTTCRGPMNASEPEVRPLPLNPMLFVLNAPCGPDKYQALAPQSITPDGYCPFKVRLTGLKPSKLMIWIAAECVTVNIAAALFQLNTVP